ncbi:serine/threonine protein phosphatase 1 [Marinobacter segnicrescens]|uniref:Serine/threonine protein phosphatase 1 n=1 Tax=Marinobacter segnicrescens TaxID=430453 RepID=A0A1I0I5S4_9GAMM|nr:MULTISPECIES: metallophosphoesterase [Marinobacter]SET91979.1 serine/threonine protein phosphatase 1 [Marinobacter segnicrescens]
MRRNLIVHQHFERNRYGRDWVCGDLHGHWNLLMAILGEKDIDLETDRLFLLGDLIDRGPQSADILNWALQTDNVFSVMGNHELMFIGGAIRPGYREEHRRIGGEWVDELSFGQYRNLTTKCANHLPLTMTIETAEGPLGLVHAQSPVDDWCELATIEYTDQIAIDCTWPWNRATGPGQSIAGVSAVVSGHIGTQDIVQRGNQLWIDTLETSGEPTLLPVQELVTLARRESS